MKPHMKVMPGPHDTQITYTDEQAEGAIPNGTRIVKCNSKLGDGHRDGHEGEVIGSMDADGEFIYFVRWDGLPYPIGIAGYRIRVKEPA